MYSQVNEVALDLQMNRFTDVTEAAVCEGLIPHGHKQDTMRYVHRVSGVKPTHEQIICSVTSSKL